MRSNKTLFIFFFFLSLIQANAQYGYGNGYGNGYGSGRMNRTNQIPDTPEKPAEIPVEVTVAEIMKKMKPELNLDALQEIAIANVLKESIRSQGIIIKDETTGQEQKMKEMEALSETTNRKINAFLNPEQKELYKKWVNQKNDSKKKTTEPNPSSKKLKNKKDK